MSETQQPETQQTVDNTQQDSTGQVTTPTPTTKPAKNPKRVAAGKLVAEQTRQALESQKRALAEANIIIANHKADKEKEEKNKQQPPAANREVQTVQETADSRDRGSTFSSWVAIAGVVVGAVGVGVAVAVYFFKPEQVKYFLGFHHRLHH